MKSFSTPAIRSYAGQAPFRQSYDAEPDPCPPVRAPHPFNYRHIEALEGLGCLDPRTHLLGMPHNSRTLGGKIVVSGASQCRANQNLSDYRSARKIAEQELLLLPKLCNGRLSDELVLHILADIAISHFPVELELRSEDTLRATVTGLLGSAAPQTLRLIMQDAILEVIPIRLDVMIERIVPATGIALAIFPCSVGQSILHKLHTLALSVHIHLNTQYPATLFRLCASIPSIRAQLPQFRHLHISLHVWGTFMAQAGILAHPCHAGYSGLTTYSRVLEKLITAMQSARPGRRHVLTLHLHPSMAGAQRSSDLTTIISMTIDDRPATQILSDAFQAISEDEQSGV
ncbi:hypothetical protein LTR10_011422 [Elasticomyces elasticus]|nr:hypothetical protein LTR10_011422 [Elasticomyces elasticus]KAK4966169.1 hypothetical protein LTR42_011329 [Elasticomyces elasticus]